MIRAMSERHGLFSVVVLTAIALLLRGLIIGQTTWGDELFLYEIVHDRSLGEAMQTVRDTESTPALYFVVAWLFAQVGGDDFLMIRIPALLFSVATVPVIYALGVRTVGRTPALIAAALFAIAPFDLFYGTEGRAYAAVAFFAALSTLGLVMLVRGGGRGWIAVLAVAVAGAAYSHYLAIFVLLAQFFFALLLFAGRWREVLVAHAGAALLYVPWIPAALEQLRSNTSERLSPLADVGEGAAAVVKLWFGHPFTGLATIPGDAAMAVIALGLVAAAVFAVAAAAERGFGMSRTTALLLVLMAATPVAAAAYELTDSSVFGPRYLSASVPAGALVIGALLMASRRPVVGVACTALVIGGVAVGTGKMLRNEGARPDYRAAAQDIDRIARPGEPVLELTIFAGPPSRNLAYFLERGHAYFGGGDSLDAAFPAGHRTGRFHIVGATTGFASFLPLLDMEGRGFRLVDERTWDGIVPLRRQTYESVR